MKRKTWDEVVKLISSIPSQDEIGNPVTIDNAIEVAAIKRPVSRSERYVAGHQNIEVHAIFIVHTFEYEQQNFVEHDGVRYSVVGEYLLNQNEIELKCRKKVRDYRE